MDKELSNWLDNRIKELRSTNSQGEEYWIDQGKIDILEEIIDFINGSSV